MNKLYYTGVGSRNTPLHTLNLIYNIAMKLQIVGYTLRSGGADGADSAFELGAGRDKEIYYTRHATKESMEIASRFHPAWDRCSAYAKKLHGRNVFQVLGKDLKTPSHILICWTPDGCISHSTRTIKTGGTGTAISIADHYGITIYNLQIDKVYQSWDDWVNRSLS